jgi:hypothetical protein
MEGCAGSDDQCPGGAQLRTLGFKAAALEGGFGAWKEKYEVKPAEPERGGSMSALSGFS